MAQGREPAPEDFPHEALEDLPAFVAAAQHPLPAYEEPQQHVPSWVPPSEPRPIGFLRGTAPVIICDVSGTMNPRQQGRFREMKRCAVELLDPEGGPSMQGSHLPSASDCLCNLHLLAGTRVADVILSLWVAFSVDTLTIWAHGVLLRAGELATAAVAFDVITFCSGAWSWAAGYGERMGLLASSQVLYSGRQVGGKANSKTPGGGDTGTSSGLATYVVNLTPNVAWHATHATVVHHLLGAPPHKKGVTLYRCRWQALARALALRAAAPAPAAAAAPAVGSWCCSPPRPTC